ncbi:MAG: radical SAM protein, partial [Anaerovorax sp.]|nr:radical SAM protein [Anaerovorax sp.]
CYARENHSCGENLGEDTLTSNEWSHIFDQAKNLGIGFILLAGGEPLLRKDIIEEAAKYPEILFPIFTNGTMINESYIKTLQKYRNLIPLLSIEGSAHITDERRGDGVYEKLMQVMDEMNRKGILYGISLTVTKRNIKEVSEHTFVDTLHKKGCKGIIYVEYVPVDASTRELTPSEEEREYLSEQLYKLRKKWNDMVFLSFPGDEKASGGCLAAGRGFLHINAKGGAEPCPFSPFSDINVVATSLKEALHSPLFMKLSEENVMAADHIGGCVLFEQEEKVKKLLLK